MDAMNASRYFASRAGLCSAFGEVEECHDGILQQAAKVGRANGPIQFSADQLAHAVMLRHALLDDVHHRRRFFVRAP